MLTMKLSQIAAICGGKLYGADQMIQGVCIDTRQASDSSLFFAFKGKHIDAHDLLEQQYEWGVGAAVVERVLNISLPHIVVKDVRDALWCISAHWRRCWDPVIIAVTGSNGKTTVKHMLSSILAPMGPLLHTSGNLNNEIGVPLTILALDPGHHYAVIEMGANHPGEIARLSALVAPHVSIVTGAAAAHLEGFGTIEGVAKAKGEIYSGLPYTGTAVINVDDRFAELWENLAYPRRIVRFGLNPGADIHGKQNHASFILHTPAGEARGAWHFLGLHNWRNALAAAAAAYAIGAAPEIIARGLSSCYPVSGRLNRLPSRHGGVLIDDSYNANPGSLKAAIQVLANQPAPRILLLGDMAELGKDAEHWHRKAGLWAKEMGISSLWTTGELACLSAHSFGGRAHTFKDSGTMGRYAIHHIPAGASILVKGSRCAHMERVVESLRDQSQVAKEL